MQWRISRDFYHPRNALAWVFDVFSTGASSDWLGVASPYLHMGECFACHRFGSLDQ
jgi:hypothetical protein